MDLRDGSKGRVNVTFDSFNEQALVGPLMRPHMSLVGQIRFAAGMILNRSMAYTVPLEDAWRIQEELDARSSAF